MRASTTERLAGDLSDVLELSGFDVLEPQNAVDGAVHEESIMYTKPDMPNSMLPTSIANAVPIGRWETLRVQPTPALTQEMLDSADVIVVVGNDLANAPWLQDKDTPLIDPGIGRLLIIDATTSDRGQQAANAQAQDLRAAGVDIAGIVPATAPVEHTMLMPLAGTSLWTYAIAELANVGGFDTWTPSLVSDPILDDVTAALVVGDRT